MNKKIVFLAIAVVILFLVISGVKFSNFDVPSLFSREKNLSIEEAEAKALAFINGNLVQAGTAVKIEKTAIEGGLYRMDLDVSGQKVTAYMTKDGQKFFPSGIDMAEAEKKISEEEAPKEIVKSEKPLVELFVMSYCPYGTQAQKGILPAIATLGDKIDFKLRFVDYIMHDKKEIDENLRQYCVGQEDSKKLNEYLTCFLKVGEGTEDACLESVQMDKSKIDACMASADKQFDVTKNYEDKESWSGGQFPLFNVHKAENEAYGVKGSPTLVINGKEASSGRDSASYLKNICLAFNEAPQECETELSATAPSPGFGEGTTSAGTEASCAD